MTDRRNPLEVAAEARGLQGAGSGKMAVGEVRHIQSRHGTTTTIVRTARPYVDDLADAYNAARTRRDLRWIVDANGELRLVADPTWSARHAAETARRHEEERDEWEQRNDINRPSAPPH